MSDDFITAETVGAFVEYIGQDNPDRAGVLLDWIIQHQKYYLREFLSQLTSQEKDAWDHFITRGNKNTQR